MEKFNDKWIDIPLQDIKNGEYIEYLHSKDIDKIDTIIQHVLKCIGNYNGYLVLEIDNNNSFRIKPNICKVTQAPNYFIGNEIKVLNSKGFLEFGIIKDFFWHSKRSKYIFSIEINGKIKSRSYFEEDIELLVE